MRHRVFIAALCVVLPVAALAQTLPTTHPATAPALLSIPDTASQTQSREMIHTIFKMEYGKTAAADRMALARRLVAEAAGTKDDASARYVLLTDAVDLAALAGDADTIVKAANELSRLYAVDGLELKRAALVRAVPGAATAEANEALARQCLDTADAAALVDAFDPVVQMANVAEGAANKTRKVAFVAAIQVHLADVRGLAQEFTQVKQARNVLQADPDDAEAHLVIGRFYALHKGQWAEGLKHLAAGSDATLRDLAAKELAEPVDGIDQAALADGWWDFADKTTGLTQSHTRRHAVAWYERSQKSLSGITLTRIQSRLHAAVPATQPAGPAANPAAPAAGNTVNLLALIDPGKDAGEGQWSLEGGTLVVADGKYATLNLPYLMPDEYDLRATFTRTEGSGPIAMLLASHGKSFGFELDLKGEARFERVGTKIAKDNPTLAPVAVSNGRKYTLVVQIRNDSIRALLDGIVVTQWKTDYKDLSRYSLWKLPNEKLCGIGAHSAKVVFHAVEVVEVTGTGKAAR